MQIGPVVQYWSLDMNTGVVAITFNEPVFGNFTPVGLRIQNKVNAATYTVSSTVQASHIFPHT